MAVAAVAGVESPPNEAREPPFRIREASDLERQQAWTLQQAAFDLGEVPPPHPGNGDSLRVVVRDERVVSCLTLVTAPLSVRGATLPMGGLRHVATHPEEQNRGYGSALIRSTLREMRSEGLAVSVLFPFSFRYYRKFGYELGGNFCHFWCRPSSIPAYVERAGSRPATPADCAGLEALYARRAGELSCSMARDAQRWSGICCDGRYSTIVYEGEGPEGYAVIEETRDSYGGRLLKVLELAAETRSAWRGLLGYLSQASAESVEWLACAGALAQSGLLRSTAPLREGFKPRGIATIRPMFQFRVTDLAAVLSALAPGFPEGRYRLALRVRDELIPENAEPVAIHGVGERAELRPPRASDPYLEADIRIFSQIVSGYMSPVEAVSQGLARGSSPEAVETAERLFPSGDPFLSELDRF